MKPRGNRKTLVGTVVGDKMSKTLVVECSDTVKHRLYGKYIRRRRRLKVHNEAEGVKLGDRVEIVESRPVSKTKRWRLARVIEAGQEA